MTNLINFLKKFEFVKKSYIWIILILFYIPLIYGFVFSFNSEPKKGSVSLLSWNGFSSKGWLELFSDERVNGLANSFLIAIINSFFVIVISLISVFAIWNQKNKMAKAGKNFMHYSSSVPLINPDIVTAVALTLVFSIFFGTLYASSESFYRSVIAHIVMSLPYGIMLMYPRSEKFNKNLLEASYDLGYGKIKSWFKIYFVYMLSSIVFVFVITSFLSFDDFIITRITSNTSTIGTQLYEGSFQTWALALGAIMLLFVVLGNALYLSYKNAGSFKSLFNRTNNLIKSKVNFKEAKNEI
ncbi:SPERMIDINE/PUTRESCINE ABC TRANSPORTER PERMEASE PROTEIN POTC [Mycoplasmopsis pulmonis]|uniref:SPERMIDINE/PUTRESCINE ABC TRANSPORTER PERMEASE PROTEIN POTC n=1 Tax=Mycoplasmopsis pulmonis (strain UAB CTIP) TaxID=272635 RepID=Q98QE3_MYCPU|nr:ABC transporter permease [Mycoplasmopsis pulmonis]MDZ7293704.1 ABC transporter permease [Mycoplasmopsis pulmonis]CAC13596.1 SPERMIDINE/PUTRESCINE ABC TRANSPORTER PERMEASE PROTEIN POTC [Mycoplasmopsis pulmonis]VEU68185.1 spermidine/putrescine ABC transporter membrane protein [Mycoplasmopsis pulmonis]